ncbi:MAG: aminotransferase class V-fold PLP-dependent enzyme [Phycisphaerales bacterium]|jgi:cysteine desulfurase|nr:aminotransferase class V-fold PLP-dependent enzyme [Phycisphaerales bacterium]
MELIYLDNNATTRPDERVVEGMVSYLGEWYGNPSSVHRFGQRARQGIDTARGQVAALVGCAESELIFTGGGTESINTAIRALLLGRSPRKKIITSTVEHSATRELCQQLGREGAQVVEIPVDGAGALDLEQLEANLDGQTALVTLLWGNNETGVIFPVREIAKICREKKVPFHCDGTQAVGKIPVNVTQMQLDAMSFASHKFHGPKGVGGLFVRRGIRPRPLIIGGPQERGRRGGTENVPGIVGMGLAAQIAGESLHLMGKVAQLRDKLEKGILGNIPQTSINGRTDQRLPNTTNIAFHRLEAEAILLLLSENNIAASAGAACSSGSLEPSHVLRAMKIEDRIAHGAIRFSLSRNTTEAQIDQTLKILPAMIERLRSVLPVGI